MDIDIRVWDPSRHLLEEWLELKPRLASPVVAKLWASLNYVVSCQMLTFHDMRPASYRMVLSVCPSVVGLSVS